MKGWQRGTLTGVTLQSSHDMARGVRGARWDYVGQGDPWHEQSHLKGEGPPPMVSGWRFKGHTEAPHCLRASPNNICRNQQKYMDMGFWAFWPLNHPKRGFPFVRHWDPLSMADWIAPWEPRWPFLPGGTGIDQTWSSFLFWGGNQFEPAELRNKRANQQMKRRRSLVLTANPLGFGAGLMLNNPVNHALVLEGETELAHSPPPLARPPFAKARYTHHYVMFAPWRKTASSPFFVVSLASIKSRNRNPTRADSLATPPPPNLKVPQGRPKDALVLAKFQVATSPQLGCLKKSSTCCRLRENKHLTKKWRLKIKPSSIQVVCRSLKGGRQRRPPSHQLQSRQQARSGTLFLRRTHLSISPLQPKQQMSPLGPDEKLLQTRKLQRAGVQAKPHRLLPSPMTSIFHR